MRFIAALAVGMTTLLAYGGHADLLLTVSDNQIVVQADGDPNGLNCVFEGELGELGIPGYTDDPGFNSTSLSPGSTVGFNVTGPLRYWDGAAFVAPLDGESLHVINGSQDVAADGASAFVAGFAFAQASGGGSIHQHVTYWVQHPTFDDGDPFDNPITPGAYLLPLEITSSAHDTSDSFFLLFDAGLDPNQVPVAVAAAEDAFCAGDEPCPGDVDGNNTVDLTDLAIVLANFGGSGLAREDGDLTGDGNVDLSDLAELLAVFGQGC